MCSPTSASMTPTSVNLVMGPLPARRVHIHARNAGAGQALHDDPLHLLRSQSPIRDRRGAAARAATGRRLVVAAVVARQAAPPPMKGHGHGTAHALLDVSALLAEREVGVSATVEQQDRLLLPLQAQAHRLEQHGRQDLGRRLGGRPGRRISGSAIRRGAKRSLGPAGANGTARRRRLRGRSLRPRLPSQVDQTDLGQDASAHAVGQRQKAVLPRSGVGPALQGGRRRAQHADAPVLRGPHYRQVPGAVPRRRAGLLVAPVVFFVHHDGAQARNGSKDGRTRPDRHPLLARLELAPCVVALARRQPRVEHRHKVAERAPEPSDGLRRERDLGHQHDRAFSPVQHVPKELHVHQGLAGARDPVQQERPAAASQRTPQPFQGASLVGRGHELRGRPGGPIAKRVHGHGFAFDGDHASLLHPANQVAAEPVLEQDLQRLPSAGFLKALVRLLLSLGLAEHALHLVQRADLARDHDHRAARDRRLPRRVRHRRRQHGSQHQAQRRHVVVGRPQGQLPEIPGHRRLPVQHRDDSAQTRNLLSLPGDPSRHGAAPEGHLDARPHRGNASRDPVAERLVDRHRQRHLDQRVLDRRTRPRAQRRLVHAVGPALVPLVAAQSTGRRKTSCCGSSTVTSGPSGPMNTLISVRSPTSPAM